MQLINLKQLKTSPSGRESSEMRRHGTKGYVLVDPSYCYNIKREVMAILRETMTIKNILLTALQCNVMNNTSNETIHFLN